MSTDTMTAEEERLGALGAELDASSDDSGSPPEAVPIPETPVVESQPTAEKQPEGSGIEAAKEAPVAELSPYEKAKQSSKDREAKAWNKIEAEKAEITKSRLELQQEQSRIQLARQEADIQQPIRDQSGFTAADYERASRKFSEEGDEPLASQARQQAIVLRQHEQQRSADIHRQRVMASIQEVVKERPEFQNPQSADGMAVQQVLQQHPHLQMNPGGFRTAVAILDASRTANSLPELRAKIDQLTAENKRLNSLTALPATGPRAAPKGDKKITDLSPAEQERALLRMAREVDGSQDY